ncbi:hypothetical protein [Methylorubrum extorquens]|jgi:hypothetical protein|uniref:DotM C-terminal cytoplasmic domain-containing protein n=1 Tax=Methylorubrum extorquens (strain ATCC 14718 / DSM 1338 / JCM 2805 / NCIMB 9133 / AM1) TaxID=272630 RepID=C5B4X4_METEA|nr:hypothetical protein [Methylorubrum extorquens]ACS43506.1 Hypothetical protein MexAM1_META2p0659 [Methylorubrum extorquens AM1]MCP1545406.1 hypothetical protein [Methylorubrum extorquens]MCP1591358.1 hypothetical protein [Methylorubrum extorquens]
MKIELIPTVGAAICGGCAVLVAEPVMGYLISHVNLVCMSTSAIILAGAASVGLRRRRAPELKPNFGNYSPPLSAAEWLAANNIQADADKSHAAAMIGSALRQQLISSTLHDVRVEALVLCLLKAGTSKQGGCELLDELAVAATGTDPEGKTARFLLRHDLRTDPVVKDLRDAIRAHHGFAATMLLAALERARRSGRCPPSAMTWLKQVDRSLWYAVSNLGRSAYHVEGLAAIAHYCAEITLGKSLLQPNVDDAARSLIRIHVERRDVADAPRAEAA